MENKQTAVEWMAEKVGHNSLMSLADYYEILEQALAMEKEQIMDDFNAGQWAWAEHLNGKEKKDPAEYYNETYGK